VKLKKYYVIAIIILIFGINFLPNHVESKTFELNPSIATTVDECIVPKCVEEGDILFMDVLYPETSRYKIPGPHNEHTAFYIGDNQFIHAGGDLNAMVCIKNYSRFKSKAKNLAFVRVITANYSIKQDAINWSKKQRGKSFQDYFQPPWFDIKCHNPDLWWFPKSSEWYCSELVWAAYYNQGIDIDSNGWKHPWRVRIVEIINDDDTEIVYCELDEYIEIIHPNRGVYVRNNQIMLLAQKTIVFGKINVIVNTTFEEVESIKFYVNEAFKYEDKIEPYQWTWNETGFGNYTLKVEAVDTYNNIIGSYALWVWKFF